ncbi:MAG: hypothetical protein NUV91_04425 [Candidatus Omnitrophica bacterium]|nr:hypothetical protein [Candidatus Omnitrophota bacterium]
MKIKVSRYYFLIRYFLFFFSFAALLIFISLQLVSHTQKKHADLLDQMLSSFSASINEKNEIPSQTSLGGYNFIIIDQKGDLLLEPEHREAPDLQEIWKQYRTKLAYQIYKQKQGTLYYPDQTIGQRAVKSRMVRYRPISPSGWVLALETSTQNSKAILKEIYSLPVCFGVALIILLGFLGIDYIRKKESFFNKKQEEPLKGDNIFIKSLPEQEAPYGEREQFIPLLKEKEAPSPLLEDASESIPAHSSLLKEFHTSISTKDIFSSVERISPSAPLDKKDEEEEVLDKLKINLDNIKSPILRKMVEELRVR